MTSEGSETNRLRFIEISEFEALISINLPSDYRDFLLEWDGQIGEERFFQTKTNQDELWELVELFGLESTPNTRNISQNWKVSRFYDLSKHHDALKEFLAIGGEAGGSILLLEPSNGKIFLLAHDYESEDLSMRVGECTSIISVAPSFSDFRRNLLTDEECSDEDDFGKEWLELADLRKLKNEKIQAEHRQRELRRNRAEKK